VYREKLKKQMDDCLALEAQAEKERLNEAARKRAAKAAADRKAREAREERKRKSKKLQLARKRQGEIANEKRKKREREAALLEEKANQRRKVAQEKAAELLEKKKKREAADALDRRQREAAAAAKETKEEEARAKAKRRQIEKQEEARKYLERKEMKNKKGAAGTKKAVHAGKKSKKKDKASQWPWCTFHFDGETDCEEFVPDLYHRKFPARMCKSCKKRLGKHNIKAVKKKEHVLKAVEAGPTASLCWTHNASGAHLFVGGYRSVGSFCTNEHVVGVVTAARGLGGRYPVFSRACRRFKNEGKIQFCNLEWDDSSTQVLKPEDLKRALRFMRERLVAGSNVLTHCAAGQSRSVTVAVAYMIAFEAKNFNRALTAIKSRRTIADPNTGFRKQLDKLAKDGTLAKIGKEIDLELNL